MCKTFPLFRDFGVVIGSFYHSPGKMSHANKALNIKHALDIL